MPNFKNITLTLTAVLFLGANLNSSASAALSVDLESIVVSAARIDQEQYRVAGNVTVIPSEQIKESGAQNIADVLFNTLGVFVYEAGTSRASTIDIRGFGDTAARNVLVLVNGRKINNVDVSGPNLFQVPIGSIERIEVIRGGGSVLYGDNAVAGVINIVTKKGEGELSGKIGANYGSYSRHGGDLEVSGSESGLSYYMYSKYQEERGYRENSDNLTKNFNSRLAYEPNEHISLDFNFGRHQDDVGLPGGLNASELEQFGRKGTTTPDDYATTKDQFFQIRSEITPWTEKDYLGDFVFDFAYRDREVKDFAGSAFGDFLSTRNVITRTYTGKYIFDEELLERNIDFVVGFDISDSKNDIYSVGFGTDDLTIKKEEFGLFGYLQFEAFENFFINAGKRLHKAEYTFDHRSSSNYEKQSPEVSVAMGGAKYEYAPGSNIHFNYQQTFRFLATDEWFSSFTGLDTFLDEQTGDQYEVGIKHNFDKKVIASLTGYVMYNESEIFLDPTIGFFGENSNYGKTRRYGIEFDQRLDVLEFVNIDFLDKFEIFANYAYQKPEFVDGDFDGNSIPMAPEQQVSHGFMFRFLKNYNFHLNGRYIGSRFVINDTQNNSAKQEGHYVVDTKVSFENENVELYAAVFNILNKEYSSYAVESPSSGSVDFFPAPRKNYNFGVNVKF